MGKVVYIVGRTVDGRQSLLNEKISSSRYGSFLHLVPTRGRVMELEADPPFWPARRVETLTRTMYRIFEEHVQVDRFKDARFLDDGLKCLLLRRALETRSKEPDGLMYLSRLPAGEKDGPAYPGIYRSITRFFSFLIGNNYQDALAEDLGRRIIRLEEQGGSPREARYALESDLAWLLGDYEEAKRQIGGYDGDDVLAGVRSYLRRGGIPRIVAEADVLILDGFIFFTRIEEDILYQLANRSKEVWWLVDHECTAGDLLTSLRRAAGSEVEQDEKHGVSNDPEPADGNEADRILRPLVSLMERFEDGEQSNEVEQAAGRPVLNPLAGGFYLGGDPKGGPGEGLRVKAFATPLDEVRTIAGEIKRLHKEAGPDAARTLGRIRVIFPRLEDYSSIVREVFSEYKVPFSLTQGLPLSSHPIAHIFLQILETPLNGFRCEDLFRFFSDGLVRGYLDREMTLTGDERCDRFVQEESLIGDARCWADAVKALRDLGGCPFDIFSFDRVVRKVGLSTLGAELPVLHIEQCRELRDYYRDRHRQATSAAEREQLLSEYYRLLIQIQLMLEGLEPFRKLLTQRKPRMIVSCLERILETLGFPENIVNVPADLTQLEPTAIRALLRRDLKAYADLRALAVASAEELEVEQDLFEGASGRALLDRYYAIFRTRLHHTYLLDERNPNVVRISEWLEIRGRSFDTVFAAGLTSEAFPPKEEIDFILTEALSPKFRRPDMMDQSKHLFSHLLRNHRKALYLSYPRYREERELAPSSILVDLATWLDSELSLEGHAGVLEEAFPWEVNPYLTCDHEWLDVTRSHAEIPRNHEETLFPLSEIILKPDLNEEAILSGVHLMRSRYRADGLGEYDGLVRGASQFDDWAARDAGMFSPSQLEILANCPLRYLFARIYDVEPLEELGLEVSPRDMGIHVHAVLRILFQRLIDEGKNVADMGLERAFALARETAEEYFGRRSSLFHLEFFELQRQEFLAGLTPFRGARSTPDDGRDGLLARMLRFEEDALRGRRPKGVEYRFGAEDQTPVVIGGARIRGSIDRFDLSNQDGETAYLYDYKTGGSPSVEKIKKGLSLQLPLYMRALKRGLGFEKVSACCYSLRARDLVEESPLKQKVNDHSAPKGGLDLNGVRLLDDLIEHLRKILAEGTFHHSADEEDCPFCDYRYACQQDRRRMAHVLQLKEGDFIYSGERNRERWRPVDEFRREWREIAKGMKLAFSLKTAPARARHFGAVMDFGRRLAEQADAIPLERSFIDARLAEIKAFEREYRSREQAA